MSQIEKVENNLNNQVKINITHNSLNNIQSQDKDNSSSLKINNGQINIKNIKING